MVTGTMSDAARLLRISQPAVSSTLNHLQDRLGVLLFERIKGRLLPTPEAATLFAEIETGWKRIERIQHVAEGLARGNDRKLRIAASTSLGVRLLPTVLADLMHDQPHLRVKIELLTPELLKEAVLSGDCDIGFGVAPAEHPNLVVTPLGEARLRCVLPSGHPLGDRDAVRLADLTGERLISHSAELPEGRLVEQAFAQAGVTQATVIEVRSGQSACWCVQAGVGIALIDEFTVSSDAFPALVTRPLIGSPVLRICMVRDGGRPLSHTARALLRATKDYCARHHPLTSR